jgi:hypothetical protein
MTRSKELNERSPLRVFEHSIHGGLGLGNLGVVCSGQGVGKSAFLVCVALDYLMRERQVLHIALEQAVDRVRNYYDEIFAELARTEELEDAPQVRLGIEKNRRIHTYQGHTFSVGNLETTLNFLREHTDMNPDLMVVDGYDWDTGSPEDIEALKRIARTQEAELWMSARTPRSQGISHPKGYPDPIARFENQLDVVIQLKTSEGTVHLQLLKDHDNPNPGKVGVELDPTTLLLVKA